MAAKVQFAFELELCLKGRENWPNLPLAPSENWMSLSNSLFEALRASFPDSNQKTSATNDFGTWCITESPRNVAWFRIISPKFDFDSRKKWIDELSTMCDVIQSNGCRPSRYWSGKIHVTSPGISLDQTKGLAKTVMQHNNGFSKLHRVLCQPNVSLSAADLNPMADLERIGASYMTRVDITGDIRGLASWMNGESPIKPDPNRIWNFWPLVYTMKPPFYEGHRRTNFIEYTFEPKDFDSACARTWVNFVCLFVEGALRHQGCWTGAYNPPKTGNFMFPERFLLRFILDQARDPDVSRPEPVTDEEEEDIIALLDCVFDSETGEVLRN
ncbi:hypothetical protein F4861DRAFT_549843 [Xylaria intraflava]|nr:hypothetical protein F4861DRAFT_549843 [Xylaria intraflava]